MKGGRGIVAEWRGWGVCRYNWGGRIVRMKGGGYRRSLPWRGGGVLLDQALKKDDVLRGP